MAEQRSHLPTGMAKAAFGFFPRTYHGRFAEGLLTRSVLMLETTGRRSGLQRSVCLDFIEEGGSYYVATGWGTQCNWYRNLMVSPKAVIRVGKTSVSVIATEVTDQGVKARMLARMAANSKDMGPPPPLRNLFRTMHIFDYDRLISETVEAADTRLIQLTPSN